MSDMPPAGIEFKVDDDVFFQFSKKQTLYGTIVQVVAEKGYARVRLFNSERIFKVRLDALKLLTPDLTQGKR